ncbi:MAG: IgGFc-binding protein, partial [Sediminibacterium sp.]|nr:IgGFc-binding protein [Sediminibacterium sp.]
MKSALRKKIFILIPALIFAHISVAQLFSTVGKEFWVSIPRLYTYNGVNGADAKLYITAEKNCTGTVQDRYGNYSQNFTVTTGKPTVIDLPAVWFYEGNFETIELKGAYIQSSDSIQAVLRIAGISKSYEMTNILPLQSLGSDYMVMTYAYGSNAVTRVNSQFMLLGVEDGTEVDVTPSQQSILGTLATTFTITLNKGETYLYQGYQDLDLTGSIIHAKNCKKIVVYSGTEDTFTPIACPTAGGANVLIEQSAPINTLGTAFLITPAPNMEKELFKVLATQNNTKVYVNGVLAAVLNKGNSYEDYFSIPSFIKTNKPVITAYFGVSFCTNSQAYGGPFMVLVTPLEQAIKSSTIIATASPPGVTKQYLQIHVRTRDKDLSFMDGRNIGSKFKTFPTHPEYAYAQIELDSGAYTIKNANGFTAEVNTNSIKTFTIASHGYSAGSLLNKSNQYASVNGNSTNLQKEFYFCPLQTVNFEAIRQDTVFSKVFWYFDDGTIDSGNV